MRAALVAELLLAGVGVAMLFLIGLSPASSMVVGASLALLVRRLVLSVLLLGGVFYMPKWADVLVKIDNLCFYAENSKYKENYLERLKRKAKMAVSHLKIVVNALEAAHFVERVWHRHRRYFVMTEKGKKAANHVRELQIMLENERK